MTNQREIEKLFEEAMHFAKYSKSKTAVKFWSTIHKLEKLLAASSFELDRDQKARLNAAKRKFS